MARINKRKERTFDIKRYCIQLLRRGFLRSRLRMEVVVANRKKMKDSKSGREVFHVKCNKCKRYYRQKEISVDHVEPVVDPKVGWKSLDEFASRLFCKLENLQILCKKCHKKKSDGENDARRNTSRKKGRKSKRKSRTRKKNIKT